MNPRGTVYRYPFAVWFVVLATVFITEHIVMGLLPFLLPQSYSRFVEASIDAFILTTVIAPVMWWTLVRPLRAAILLRENFLADLFTRLEGDRRHTAHELHDGVGQSLSLLVSGLKSAHEAINEPMIAARCHHLLELAQSALKEVRRLSLGLRPSLLDDLGLGPALERLAADTREYHDIDVKVDADALTGTRLPETIETALFRIAQEAIANLVKHAAARSASIKVRRRDGVVSLTVTDDGRGFDSAGATEPGHLGLRGMRERALLLGGRFALDSAPGRGTSIWAAIPVRA